MLVQFNRFSLSLSIRLSLCLSYKGCLFEKPKRFTARLPTSELKHVQTMTRLLIQMVRLWNQVPQCWIKDKLTLQFFCLHFDGDNSAQVCGVTLCRLGRPLGAAQKTITEKSTMKRIAINHVPVRSRQLLWMRLFFVLQTFGKCFVSILLAAVPQMPTG